MQDYRQIRQNTDAAGHERLAAEMAEKGQTRLNLDVNRSKIKDISFIGLYKHITHLFLVGAKKGCHHLADLPNLEKVGLSQCKVSSFDCMEGLNKLVELDLLLGSVSDYSSVANLKNLKSFTVMRSRSLKDIDFLSQLRELQYFKIDQCGRVCSIPDFSENKALRRVHIEGLNKLPNIDAIATAPNLESLVVIDCKLEVSDFQPFTIHPKKPIVLPGIAPIGSKKGNLVDELLGDKLMKGFYGTEYENFEIQ